MNFSKFLKKHNVYEKFIEKCLEDSVIFEEEHKDKMITLEGKIYKLVPIEEEEFLDDISIKEKYKSGNYIAIRLKDNKWELCDQDYKENFRDSSNIKLIKKEHSDILKAYLKDKDIKTEYRWYDEPWMELEGDFIENYDENMQLRIAKKEFEPFTLNIEVKTLDDLKLILNRFDLDERRFKEIFIEHCVGYYDVYSDIDTEIWVSLREKLKEFE